jgi:hypothetical protein
MTAVDGGQRISLPAVLFLSDKSEIVGCGFHPKKSIGEKTCARG